MVLFRKSVWFYVAISILAGVAYLGISGILAFRELTQVQSISEEIDVETVVNDPLQLVEALGESRQHAAKAEFYLSGPLWWAISKVPFIGETPAAATAVAISLDQIFQSTLELESGLASAIPENQSAMNLELILILGKSATELETPIEDSILRLSELKLNVVPSGIANSTEKLLEALNGAKPYLDEGANITPALPILLGLDRPREWLLVFENGAEARATGGFPGGWGRLTVSNGQFDLKNLESNDAVASNPLVDLDRIVPREVIDLYSNDLSRLLDMNLSPDFPLNASLMHAIYLQNKGSVPEGVIAMDQQSLSSLMKVTGEVSVSGYLVNSENVATYVTKTVYELFPDPLEKDAALLTLIQQVFEKLSKETNPIKILQMLVPALNDNRISAWSSIEVDQRKILASRLGGSTSDSSSPTHMAVMINGAGNKIDAYVQSDVTYQQGQCQPYLPYRESTMFIKLTNSAPSVGLPAYVTPRNDRTNRVNSEPGSTKMLVYIHSSPGSEFGSATINGQDVQPIVSGSENDRTVWRIDVELPASSVTKLDVVFIEPAVGDEPEPDLWVQPMAVPMTTRVLDGPPRCE